MVPGICFWLVARPSWSSAFFDLWEWAKCPAMWHVHSGFQIKTIQATDWSAKSCRQGAWYVTVIITGDAARSPVMTSLSFQDKLKNWCHSNLQMFFVYYKFTRPFFLPRQQSSGLHSGIAVFQALQLENENQTWRGETASLMSKKIVSTVCNMYTVYN